MSAQLIDQVCGTVAVFRVGELVLGRARAGWRDIRKLSREFLTLRSGLEWARSPCGTPLHRILVAPTVLCCSTSVEEVVCGPVFS